jgi:hypothetical protein
MVIILVSDGMNTFKDGYAVTALLGSVKWRSRVKYQALYDAAKARTTLFVRVEDNVIPFDGWFVGRIKLKPDWVDFDRQISLDVRDEGEILALAVTEMGDVYSGKGILFAHERKEYAMGYAHGAGLEGIYDVGTGKLIRRKS